jgi:hypothetical protein
VYLSLLEFFTAGCSWYHHMHVTFCRFQSEEEAAIEAQRQQGLVWVRPSGGIIPSAHSRHHLAAAAAAQSPQLRSTTSPALAGASASMLLSSSAATWAPHLRSNMKMADILAAVCSTNQNKPFVKSACLLVPINNTF